MLKINNPFEVKPEDTLGVALIRGVAKGYLQGMVTAGIGLGVLAIGVKTLEKYGVKKPEEIEEEKIDVEEMDEEWTGIRNRAQEVLDRNKNIDITI